MGQGPLSSCCRDIPGGPLRLRGFWERSPRSWSLLSSRLSLDGLRVGLEKSLALDSSEALEATEALDAATQK